MGLGVITEASLIKMHKELKHCLSQYKRSKFEWNNLIIQTVYVEDVINSLNSPFKRIAFTIKKDDPKCFARSLEVVK